MSFFEKKAYLSSYFDKKESISDRESPRRLKVALKHVRADEKVHNDGKSNDRTTNNPMESASISATDETNQLQDGNTVKVRMHAIVEFYVVFFSSSLFLLFYCVHFGSRYSDVRAIHTHRAYIHMKKETRQKKTELF